MFKNSIKQLIRPENEVIIVYNEKDVLHDLIKSSEFYKYSYRVKTNTNVDSKFALIIQFLMKNWGAFRVFRKFKPDAVFGTPILISLIGRVLPYKSIIVNEDDFDIVSKTANLGYPYADNILCPIVCRTMQFDKNCVKYQSYHELAYLHPNHFVANKQIAEKYIDTSQTYFIIRFAKLFAHHDDGISGISDEIATSLISILKPYGNIYITSERELDPKFEEYRISINPIDIHHVLVFASLYIGDSQTMAAESGVLGVPFVRFNDFVDRVSYLEELENKYQLGYGIKTNDVVRLYHKVEELLKMPNRKEVFQERRKKMLSEKIDYAAFLTWFIENYPESVTIMEENPSEIEKRFHGIDPSETQKRFL